jgi:cytoskeleton protein RodZ
MSLFTRRKHRERDHADGSAEPSAAIREPATIGELLRAKREAYGVTVAEVGATLRIRPAFLQAIEENRYDRLPGAAYALGFVRTYAEHLGFDGEAMTRRFKGEVGGFQPKRDLTFPMPLSERSLPGGAVLLVALIIAACAYAVWYYRASGDRARPDRVAEVPQVIPLPPSESTVGTGEGLPPAPPAPASPVPDGQESAPSGVTPAPSLPPAGQPSNPSPARQAMTPAPLSPPAPVSPPAPMSSPAAVSPPAPVPPAPSQSAQIPAVPEPPPAPTPNPARVFGATTGPVRIVLKATSDSWIQVREPNQSVLSMRTLKAGDIYRVSDRPGLILRTGNAGGLEVTVDGRPVAPIGPPGKSRTIPLDPDRLAAGSAAGE